jgi:purine nucleosidase
MENLAVIHDTDIGSDIDDAVALAYLLRQPRCELVGVTTVSGESGKRAMLADAVCRAAGREQVPIHAGIESPLVVPALQPHAPQFEALTDQWPHRSFDSRNTAVDFLRETIRARPGEITLLATGPLTNIAVLFALDPEIPALLKQLVLMGGVYFSRGYDHTNAEWNMRCDPQAASIVFGAQVPRLVALGLDVTTKCQMGAAEVRRRFGQAGGPLELVSSMAEVWFRHAPVITFHDPLSAAVIFEPSLCQWERQRIEVDMTCPRAQGQTYFHDDAVEKPHEIATDVDPNAFFRHYFETTGG